MAKLCTISYLSFLLFFLFVGAVNTLSVREERYFKPSPSAFIKVAERGPDTWQIRPGSYFLLPFKEAFGRQIPRNFTIFLTIKPTDESEVRLRLNTTWINGFK